MPARFLRSLGLAVMGLLLALRAAHAGSGATFILFHDSNTTTMSGNLDDLKRVQKQLQPNEKLLWFRLDGKEYVVRDPATIAQLEATWKPVSELGAEQGKW